MRSGAMTPSRRRTRSRCSSPICGASSRRKASRACCTPSGEPATSFARSASAALRRARGGDAGQAPRRLRSPGRLTAAFDRLPIRTRLASVSALLTFVILLAFAVAIGSLTVHRIRSDFNRQVFDTAKELPNQVRITIDPLRIVTPLEDFTANHAIVKVLSLDGKVIEQQPRDAPSLGTAVPGRIGIETVNGYRVISQAAIVRDAATGLAEGQVIVQYARPVAPTEATVKRVELFLLVGVLAGSVLALMAGMAIARRAMAPVAVLTATPAEIARTPDPSRHMPEPLPHHQG